MFRKKTIVLSLQNVKSHSKWLHHNTILFKDLGPVAQNQDKGLSRDIQVILDEFSFDLVAQKQVELNPAK